MKNETAADEASGLSSRQCLQGELPIRRPIDIVKLSQGDPAALFGLLSAVFAHCTAHYNPDGMSLSFTTDYGTTVFSMTHTPMLCICCGRPVPCCNPNQPRQVRP